MMDELPFPPNDLPPDGLIFFHKLTNWYENNKSAIFYNWGKKSKKLKKLQFVRPEKGEKLELPKELAKDTLYLPKFNYGAKKVIENIRHAFCHNGISYDKANKQYIIRETKKIHIDASFSLEAINELSVFFKN